ncbi:ribonuclease VapC [Longimycelium tulufanense]|uniref:Ribonuclease VapC n=1 Tax=Longimycelium tulufanense TaxID=907463 RepID=A0A8J3CJ64_9PSEU|nr:type II toxin-antitoxin system VapC family toxin [Longimycelium tulufanense]GGM85068.1 ribonuclease VapC [Longimycelium tulufanense]
MIYLDTAAAVKLVRQEAHTADLVAWLNEPQQAGLPWVSSALIEVELPRALRRSAPEALPGVPSVLARLYRLEIDDTIRQTAAAYPTPALRSLDAIHLATAQTLAEQPDAHFAAFVTYDHRLAEAARSAGLAVARPGVD